MESVIPAVHQLTINQSTSGSVPTSPTTSNLKATISSGGGGGPLDSRTLKLELLREQLRAAKIPLTKRASLSELPQSAEDCVFTPGTTRCQLPLCEDSCVQSHRHHRTHARPSKPNALLVFSRPSISMLPGSGLASGLTSGAVSSFGSPADSPNASVPTSQTSSPQQHYRRSGFGFNFGPRGSVTSIASGFAGPLSGVATPAEIASGPPSPLSESMPSSAATSAPTSPRQVVIQGQGHHIVASGSALQSELCTPIAEEKEPSQLAPSTESVMIETDSAGLTTDYWKLGRHVVNLNDYRPDVVGKCTEESMTRQDLAAAPRDDWPDQAACAFDPRSPQPPSPVIFRRAQVLAANLPNQEDRTRPELEFAIQPTL